MLIVFSRKSESKSNLIVKDIRGWQFLTIEAAETFCMVCLPPEAHFFLEKKYLGN